MTVEVVHRTLLKLAKTRKVWPKFFRLQLDNTTSDCKNHTVMAYMAWLEATGVFEVTTIAFLLVGHTHEDIDGFFGMLRRFLMRLEVGLMTIPALHKAIRDCFRKTHNEWLESDADKEAIRDKHFNVEGMQERTVVEHISSTYDWDRMLLQKDKKVFPQGQAFATLENIGQLRDPDVYRPHWWQFSIDGGVVVLNLKHWSADDELWNEHPMPVWKRVPELRDLVPAAMEFSDSLQKMHKVLNRCNDSFERTGLRCGEYGVEPPHYCPNCECSRTECRQNKKSSCANKCMRCQQVELMGKYLEHRSAMNVCDADMQWWKSHFDNLTQAHIDATLVPISEMELPKCARVIGDLPSVQAQMDALPRMMQQPGGLKCQVRVLGMGPRAFRTVCAKSNANAFDDSRDRASKKERQDSPLAGRLDE
jgi:hypothetical protein